MDLTRLISSLPGKVSPVDKDIIERAYRVAEEAHRDQIRASGEPYIQHCLAVASILVELGMPVSTIASGLLHDSVEDSDLSTEDIRRDFSSLFNDDIVRGFPEPDFKGMLMFFRKFMQAFSSPERPGK